MQLFVLYSKGKGPFFCFMTFFFLFSLVMNSRRMKLRVYFKTSKQWLRKKRLIVYFSFFFIISEWLRKKGLIIYFSFFFIISEYNIQLIILYQIIKLVNINYIYSILFLQNHLELMCDLNICFLRELPMLTLKHWYQIKFVMQNLFGSFVGWR